ncbi:MAG: hypothetical protein ABSD74_14045 [Rhizomicrobium sp.]|jgi:hypothetical protein
MASRPKHPFKEHFIRQPKDAPNLFDESLSQSTALSGRLFFLSGYMDAVARMNIPDLKHLHRALKHARLHKKDTDSCADAVRSWQKELGEPKDWTAPSTTQLKYVRDGEPLKYNKALLLTLALEIYQEDHREEIKTLNEQQLVDVWGSVHAIPAYYKVVREGFDGAESKSERKKYLFDANYLKDVPEDAMRRFEHEAARLIRPSRIRRFLEDIADGGHMTFELAQLVTEHLAHKDGDLKVTVGLRKGRGNIKQASRFIAIAEPTITMFTERVDKASKKTQ